jgi:hypothetical protein
VRQQEGNREGERAVGRARAGKREDRKRGRKKEREGERAAGRARAEKREEGGQEEGQEEEGRAGERGIGRAGGGQIDDSLYLKLEKQEPAMLYLCGD